MSEGLRMGVFTEEIKYQRKMAAEYPERYRRAAEALEIAEGRIEQEVYTHHKYGNVLDVVSGSPLVEGKGPEWDLFGIDGWVVDSAVLGRLERCGLALAHMGNDLPLEPEGSDEHGIMNDAEAIARALECGLALVRVPDALEGEKAKYCRWLVLHRPGSVLANQNQTYGWTMSEDPIDFDVNNENCLERFVAEIPEPDMKAVAWTLLEAVREHLSRGFGVPKNFTEEELARAGETLRHTLLPAIPTNFITLTVHLGEGEDTVRTRKYVRCPKCDCKPCCCG